MIKNDDSDAFTTRHSFWRDEDIKLYYRQLFETVIKYQAVRMCRKLRGYQYFSEWMEEGRRQKNWRVIKLCADSAMCNQQYVDVDHLPLEEKQYLLTKGFDLSRRHIRFEKRTSYEELCLLLTMGINTGVCDTALDRPNPEILTNLSVVINPVLRRVYRHTAIGPPPDPGGERISRRECQDVMVYDLLDYRYLLDTITSNEPDWIQVTENYPLIQRVMADRSLAGHHEKLFWRAIQFGSDEVVQLLKRINFHPGEGIMTRLRLFLLENN
jgi:hypothetical protein